MTDHPDPIAVSWQLLDNVDMAALIERDVNGDFCWWRTPDDYDPLGISQGYFSDDRLSLADFFGTDTGYAVALQIDLCRPAADLLDLRYPGQGVFNLFDTDDFALGGFRQFGIAENWLGLSVTTTDDHPVSAVRRSLVFPNIELINSARGCNFDTVRASSGFADLLERSLNRYIGPAMAYSHWVHKIGSDGDGPVSFAFEFITGEKD